MSKITKEQIYITKSNMHVLNSAAGKAVFSENIITHGSDYDDFLRGHIFRLFSDDSVKLTSFTADSPVKLLLDDYKTGNFVHVSKQLAGMLYGIMEDNIDIPPADLIVAEFTIDQTSYLALLKLNYKGTYGHVTDEGDVDILMHRDMIPSSGKLKEAAVIDLSSGLVRIAEKAFEIEGEKENYFSKRFLMCREEKSDSSKVRILDRILRHVQREYDTDTPQEALRIKDAAARCLEEDGSISFKDAAEIFFEDESQRASLDNLIQSLDVANEVISPVSDSTVKKLTTQEFVTESGIRIIVPLVDDRNKDNVEFSYDNGGSVIIKNVGQVIMK